jgi:hypothetical protein
MSTVTALENEVLELKTYPPGLVGVLAQDTARFSMFGASITRLQIPAGSDCQWVIGNDIPQGMNTLIRHMRDTDEWVWIMGDDHAFAPFILMSLLAHDVDVVVPLCLTRQPPFDPVIYMDWYNEAEGLREKISLDEFPTGGLVEIHSSGSAGMLVKRHVLEAIGDPWFQRYPDNGKHLAEDLYFCDRVREEGFKIYADLDTKLGHITTSIVWPQLLEEGWSFGFGFPKGFMINMPHGTWIDE